MQACRVRTAGDQGRVDSPQRIQIKQRGLWKSEQRSARLMELETVQAMR